MSYHYSAPLQEAHNAGQAAYKANTPASANPHGDPAKGRHTTAAQAWIEGWTAAAIAELVIRSTTDLDLIADRTQLEHLARRYEDKAATATEKLKTAYATPKDISRNQRGAYTKQINDATRKAAEYRADAAKIQREIDRRAKGWKYYTDEELQREIHIERSQAGIDHPARRRGHMSRAREIEAYRDDRREIGELLSTDPTTAARDAEIRAGIDMEGEDQREIDLLAKISAQLAEIAAEAVRQAEIRAGIALEAKIEQAIAAQGDQTPDAAEMERRHTMIAAALDRAAGRRGVIYQAAAGDDGQGIRIEVLKITHDGAGDDYATPAGQATAEHTRRGWNVTE